MAADFHEYYGLSLPHLLRSGEYTPDYILGLALQLPVGSRVVASLQDQDDRWSRSDYILADIFDAINQTTRAALQTKRPPKIPRYTRPQKVRRSAATVSQALKAMGLPGA